MHIVIATERPEIVDLPAIQEIVRLGVHIETCRAEPETYHDTLRDIIRADTFGILIDGPFIESSQYNDCPILQLIVSTDFDHVKSVEQRKFVKANVNAAYDDSRAELALGLALAQIRNIVLNDASVRSGKWAVQPSNQLSSLSVGVFSSSSVGQQVRKLFAAFAISTEQYSGDISPNTADADKHDLVCLVDDMGDKSLLERALSSLRVGGMLVDISRFSAVALDRLEELVDSGRLLGAATIVYAVNQEREERSSNIVLAPAELLRTAEALEKARRLASEEMLNAIRQEMLRN